MTKNISKTPTNNKSKPPKSGGKKTQKNLGGRINMKIGKQVRYLDANACVSTDVYIIDVPHTDYKARVALKLGDNLVQTHYDRILPVETGGKAIAVLGDKRVTITCPHCHKVTTAEPDQTLLTCCKTLEIHFMPEAAEELKNQAAQQFDLQSLTKTFEVWVKEGAKFNESIALTTVQLVLLEGEQPRKMSFNLYDGKLSTSGKSVDLHLEEFKSGVTAEGSKARWYKVDPTKYHKALQNNGYNKLSAQQ